MKIATAYVELRTDKSKLSRDLDDVETDVKSKAKSTASAFAQIFGAAAFGAAVKGSVDAASTLNETIGKTKQLFGQDADAVIAFSKTTADSMGLSQRAYLDAASGLKGLLDNLGMAPAQATAASEKMVQLGADLASMFDGDPAAAVEAIGAALRGESEPIRAYNININEAAIKTKALELGLYSGKGAIDASAKAQATLALITDQSTAAQGDFARTADGAANSERRASAKMEDSAASLGEVFLPIYTRIVQLVGQAAEVFGSLPKPVQTALVALVGFVALSGPIHSVTDMVKSLGTQISKLGPNVSSAATGLGVFAGVTLVAFSIRAKQAAHDAESIARNIGEISRATSDKAAVEAFIKALEMMVGSGQHAGEAFEYLARTNLEGAKRVLEVGAASGLAKEGLDRLRVAVENEDAARAAATETTKKYGETSDTTVPKIDDQTAAANALKAVTDGLAQVTEEATRKSDAFAQSLQGQIDKLAELYPKEYDAVTAKYDYAKQTETTMIAVDNLNKTLGDHKAKQEDVKTATDNARDAIIQQSEKYATLDGAALGSEGAIRRQIQSLTDTATTLAPGSPLRIYLDGYIADLARIQERVDTEVALHIVSKYNAVNPNAPGYLPPGGHGATGQPTRRGALMEFGEGNRPEVYEQNGKMYLLPNAAGQVMPWGNAAGSSGGGQTINVYNNGREFTVDDMSRAIQLARLS